MMADNGVSIGYIFKTFLKLGTTAFGGYMSLVAIVQKQLVEIDKRLKEEDLLDGISLTSVLPGPVAVNTIVYVGYKLRGLLGALAAFTGIILPSFLMVLLLSWFYMQYGTVPMVKNFFTGIAPAVTALILTVGINMARKTIKSRIQSVVCVVALLSMLLVGGVLCTFFIILGSGLLGYICSKYSMSDIKTDGNDEITDKRHDKRRTRLSAIIFVTTAFVLIVLSLLPKNSFLPLKIASTFSGISLTLFGGGYVVIPALHELFVNNLEWLSPSAFADGIAIGQITPGPIFITATFIGYQVAGTMGACIATLCMFTPPAVVTVILSRFVESIRRSESVKSSMKCIRAAVIGMVFAAVYTVGKAIDIQIGTVIIFIVVTIISYKYNISPIFLILGSGIVGLLLF